MPLHHRMGPPEAYGQPPRTGRFWFDMLAAMAAIVISVVSLVVALRGEKTQHGLLSANAWPYLELSKDELSAEDKLDVENEGVGPAKIYSFEVFYQGQPVESERDLLKRCCGYTPSVDGPVGYGSVDGNVLRPGEHILSLYVKPKAPDEETFRRFTAAMKDLTFRGCYCSILDECWVSDLQSLQQTPVASCPVAKHQFVLGDAPDQDAGAKPK